LTPHRLTAEEERLLGAPRMSADVDRADAVAAARAEVRRLTGGALSPERLADARLATSELVTNSLIHVGDGCVTVWAGVDDRRLRVEVHDDGPGIAPDVFWAAPRPDRLGGRGLALVRLITDRCGHSRARWAMTWFELDFERRRPPG
jgi:anti-sigma regulatory factor (Ser/Thr protein kinase)